MVDIVGPANAPNAVTIRPADTRTFAADDSWFKDCTSPVANDGTKLQAGFMNSVAAQFRNFIRGNGLTAALAPIVAENNADSMLLVSSQHMIQRGLTNYAIDSGTANAMVASISPTPAELKSGLIVRIKKSAVTNGPGAVTLALNGFSAKPVLRMDGTALRALDLPASMPFEAMYDITLDAFVVLNFSPGQLALAANKTIYVNQAIGNDANDGISNTVGHALLTVQAAINLAFGYAPSQYVITIQVAAGNYTGGCRTPPYAGPPIVINGSGILTCSMNALTEATAPGFGYAFLVQGPNTMTVTNFTATNSVSSGGPALFTAASNSSMETGNTRSLACGNGVFQVQGPGFFRVGHHTFAGNCQAFFYVNIEGYMFLNQSAVFTIGANITVGIAVAWVGGICILVVPGPPPTWVMGGFTVTGKRYDVSQNAIISAVTLGINFFPGTVAGTAATGGLYLS